MSEMYPNNQDIEIFGEQVSWPGVDANGKFTNGSFSDPMVKPSFIPAETINLILDNLSSIIKKCGGIPNATMTAQIADLITHLAVEKAIVMRDGHGRAKVAAPQEPDDIARLAEINAAKDGQTGYALYEGGRNLLSVLGAATVPEVMAILRERCNGEGRPNFDGLFIGDYVDIPSLIVNGTTYANVRVLLSGFNHYRNPSAPEGYRNMQNHILFTFDKIVLKHRINPSNTNVGGYPSSELRTFLEGVDGSGAGIFATGLREAIGNFLYTVKKYASIKGTMLWGNYTVFPPTALEVGALFYYQQSDGFWWPDDEDDNLQIQRRFPIYNIRCFQKKNHGNNQYDWYWLSSPLASYASSSASAAFASINCCGLAGGYGASLAGGVAPAFCVA
jgi:hypothetical protein